jgi:cytochrome P450
MSANVEFDIDDPAIADDPYAVFTELRRKCPVGFTSTRGGFWYIADYDTARFIFRTPEDFSNAHAKIPALDDPLGKEIPLELEGDEHSQWRAVLDPLVSISRQESPRGAIRAEAEKLLTEVAAAGECDFMQAFAVPYPSRIFCLLMGLPPEGLDHYLRWGRALSKATSQDDAAAALSAFHKAREGVSAVFEVLRVERLEHGLKDDVVSYLLGARIDGRPVTQREYQAVCQMLFVAGLETVTSTLGNIAWFLAENPGHRRRLISEPGLIPKAVEELLRYESVVSPGRVVTRDIEVAGCSFSAGDRVMLLTGSAGRDGKAFPDPDEVNFDRLSHRHLAFGVGPHRCLGSHLARIELRIFLEELGRLLPDFHLTPGREVVRSMGMIKNVDALPITVGHGQG